MKTITYNPNTHVLVPKGMMCELLGLQVPISKGEFSKDLFDGFQMHQYSMRYLDEAIAAAPQPDPVDVEPVAWLTPDGEGWRMRFEAPVTETKLGWMPVYEHPDPEVAKLRAQLAVAREALSIAMVGGDYLPTERAQLQKILAQLGEK